MYFQKSDTTILWTYLPQNKQKAIFAWKTVIFILYTRYHFVNETEEFYRRLNIGIFSRFNFSFFHLWKGG